MGKTVQLSKLQKFHVQIVNRKQLVGAPYNPRQIDENARKKLRANIKKVGLIQPLIWNKRSGHIVAGHQRLAIMDGLERRDDYNLEVAVVDFDEKTEKEQVVFLNNEMAMGSFDLPKLESVLKEIDFEAAGFDKLDLEVMLPGWAKPQSPEARQQMSDVENVVADIEQARRDDAQAGDEVEGTENLEEIRRKKAQVRDEGNDRNPENTDVEFFVVLVFPNRTASDEFLDMIHVDRSEKYINGEMIANLIAKKEEEEAVHEGTKD